MPKVTEQSRGRGVLSSPQEPSATPCPSSCSGRSEWAILLWKLNGASWEDKDPLSSAQPMSVTGDPLHEAWRLRCLGPK